MTNPNPFENSGSIQRILEERARALARPLETQIPKDMIELVVLALDAEHYGVDIHSVQEIQPLAGVTRVPGLPPFWAGLVNVHGRLYPVLNLRRYLNLPEVESSEGHKIAVVSAAGLSVGLLADDVSEVRRIPQSDIGPPLNGTLSARRETIVGVTADLLAILDLEKLLADPALTIQDEVL